MNSEPKKSSGPNRGEKAEHDHFTDQHIEQLTDMIADLMPSDNEEDEETGPIGPIDEEETGSYAPSKDELNGS